VTPPSEWRGQRPACLLYTS